jgi:hypothetical protein
MMLSAGVVLGVDGVPEYLVSLACLSCGWKGVGLVRERKAHHMSGPNVKGRETYFHQQFFPSWRLKPLCLGAVGVSRYFEGHTTSINPQRDIYCFLLV